MDRIGAFEIWETMPWRNHYGGVMRKVGEEIEVDNVIYAVIEVTPIAPVRKRRAARW